MIEFHFLKDSAASRLTTGAMVNAANPDSSGFDASKVVRLSPDSATDQLISERLDSERLNSERLDSDRLDSDRLDSLNAIAKLGRSLSTAELESEISQLQREHKALDREIFELSQQVGTDELGLRRRKKRKLQLKDMIVALQMLLVPDIPA